ncbi:MAG TPA: DNA polymerase III subunit beta, partial [Mycobacteriales bacterium]|nr:DNA polymerase III subunit beta [Mycobacteriales bacterium]
MKLRADRGALAVAASDVARALPTRPSAPILNGMLLDADGDGRVTLTAYDFDTAITVTLAADVL